MSNEEGVEKKSMRATQEKKDRSKNQYITTQDESRESNSCYKLLDERITSNTEHKHTNREKRESRRNSSGR